MSASLLGSQWRKSHHRLLAVIFICCTLKAVTLLFWASETMMWATNHCHLFYKELRSLNTDLNQRKDMLFPTSTQYSEGVNILVQHHGRFWWLWCNLQSYNIFSFHIMQILLMKNTHTHICTLRVLCSTEIWGITAGCASKSRSHGAGRTSPSRTNRSPWRQIKTGSTSEN